MFNSKLERIKLNKGLVLCVVLGLMSVTPIIAQADNLNPGVVNVNSTYSGMSYGEWSAVWWQWAFSIPTPQNPLADNDGSNAANGQQGPVWFLAGKLCDLNTTCGTSDNPATANRVVNVPADKAIFFPILNAEADNLAIPPTSYNESQLRGYAKANMDMGENMVAEVDGVTIKGLGSALTTQYRVTSPVFNYRIPDDNIYSLLGYNFPKQTVKGAVADGVYLMLQPLPVGKHTIHFKGNFGTAFYLDIYYTINVVPT